MGRARPAQTVLQLLFEEYLDDQQSAKFVQEVSRRYTIGTLERLADFGPRLARRAATSALGYLGDFSSNAVMGRRLNDADRGVRMLAHNAIHDLWYRDGSPAQRQQLQSILRLNAARRFDEAIRAAGHLQDEAPWFAEAWNQRAVAHAHQGGCAPAAKDYQQTLELNPYHFEAAVGMGQCYLELNNAHSALECFRRAVRLNVGLEGVRAQITLLVRALEEQEG